MTNDVLGYEIHIRRRGRVSTQIQYVIASLKENIYDTLTRDPTVLCISFYELVHTTGESLCWLITSKSVSTPFITKETTIIQAAKNLHASMQGLKRRS